MTARRPIRLLGEGFQVVAVALLGGLLLLAAAEAALRLAGIVLPGAGSSDRLDRFDATAVYAPWVQFRQPASVGGGLTTSGEHRRTFAADPEGRPIVPEPPPGRGGVLWVFGGSTVFGWNVDDGETLPSQLWGELLVRGGEPPSVVNFGQPYYWSVQEGVLFHALLVRGERPTHAVFVDGLNDVLQEGSSYRVEPFWTPQVASRVERQSGFTELCRGLRLCRGVHALLGTGVGAEAGEDAGTGLDAAHDSSYSPPRGVERQALAEHLVATYRRHVDLTSAVCERFGVRCLFVVQPVPFLDYDRSRDAVADQRLFPLFGRVYPRLEELAAGDERVLYLGGELRDWQGEAPFVDGFHYTRIFHRHLAARIADHLDFSTSAAPVLQTESTSESTSAPGPGP